MNRRDWLLLLIGDGLDPIRIQKGMFLFAQESDAPPAERYAFEPYNWGPFAPVIYTDLERLQEAGLLERESVAGASYFRYRQSPAGVQTAGAVRETAPPRIRKLDDIRSRITHLDFNSLLRSVYSDHPDYASKSLFSK